MRAGIGLVSILVVVAIILMVAFSGPHGGYIPTVINAGSSGQQQAGQLAGRDDNGTPVGDTIALEEHDSNDGHLRGLTVKSILPTSPMVTSYGLQQGDEIIEIGGLSIRDQDPELSKDQVYEAYAKNQSLTVLRAGQQLTINPDTALTTAHPNLFGKPGTTVTGSAPTAPTPPAQQSPLNQIQNIPTH
jgi:PDZ domain